MSTVPSTSKPLDALRSSLQYYCGGFLGALRDVVMWVHRPHAWWGWIIALPFWLVKSHLLVYYQLRDLNLRQRSLDDYVGR